MIRINVFQTKVLRKELPQKPLRHEEAEIQNVELFYSEFSKREFTSKNRIDANIAEWGSYLGKNPKHLLQGDVGKWRTKNVLK